VHESDILLALASLRSALRDLGWRAH
jgi:hypothetical protein